MKRYIALGAVILLVLLIQIFVAIPLLVGIHQMWPTFSTFESVVMLLVFESVQIMGGMALGLSISKTVSGFSISEMIEKGG